jgi:hypothetical protein
VPFPSWKKALTQASCSGWIDTKVIDTRLSSIDPGGILTGTS